MAEETLANDRSSSDALKFSSCEAPNKVDIKAQLTADKKRRGDLINFVALKDIGRPQIEKISISDLGKIIEDYDRKNRSV